MRKIAFTLLLAFTLIIGAISFTGHPSNNASVRAFSEAASAVPGETINRINEQELSDEKIMANVKKVNIQDDFQNNVIMVDMGF